MKQKKYIFMCFAVGVLCSCNDFLDREPLDQITPNSYFASEDDLAAYSINQYSFSTYQNFDISVLQADNHTDDQAATDGSTALWVPGEKKTAESGGAWDFTAIRKLNYFFEQVLPKYQAGAIKGNAELIRHYIGEVYCLRALQYFGKLTTFGDFPIVTDVLPDNKEVLREASKRQPRNKVARFIISDLDSAIHYMSEKTSYGKNRLTKNVALLLKSRVALFEATWLKYHKGTARVPGGPGWPGAAMDNNANFTIDIDSEIRWFLQQAMEASSLVADKIALTTNTGVMNPTAKATGWNPYFEMFSDTNMEDYAEVLFWRSYSAEWAVTHAAGTYLSRGGGNIGFTRSLVDACLMKNGLPIYAANSGYAGDITVEAVKQNRDERLQLFMAAPSDCMFFSPYRTLEYPKITEQELDRSTTGYTIRKRLSYDPDQIGSGAGAINTYGCLLFRAAEAYLNYIEASYELEGRLNEKALAYWKSLRQRAGVSDDIEATIAATDLSKEGDWAKYSAGKLIDPTLYNIRRERRVEMMAEGMRMRDLKRWRALDQVKNYQVEGFNLWGGELEKLYIGSNGKSTLIPEGTASKANVSSPDNSTYLRVNQVVKTNNLLYDGYTWDEANYLEPISAKNFVTTASDIDDVETSTIYQNPGWSKLGNESSTTSH